VWAWSAAAAMDRPGVTYLKVASLIPRRAHPGRGQVEVHPGGGGGDGPVTRRRPEFPYAVSTMGGKSGSDTVAAAVSDVSAGSAGSAAGA
jgi:hypothetical protein